MTGPFTIDSASMSTIVAKAIMEGIAQDQRDILMEQAIAKLIAPSKRNDGYRTTEGPSPLQEAFDNAVEQACHRVVAELVTERPEFNDRIRAAVTEAMGKLIDGTDYDLSSRVGSAVGSAVTEWASSQRSSYRR